EVVSSWFPRLSRTYSDEIGVITAIAFILGLLVLRRRTSELLNVEKANFDTLVEHLPGLACIVSREGTLLRWNSRFQSTLGFSADELVTRPAPENLAEDYRSSVPKTMRGALKKGFAETEGAWLTKDGRNIPCYLTGVRVTVKGKPCILSVGIDIT